MPLSAGTLSTRGAYQDRIFGVRDIEVMCGSSSFLPVLHLSVCFFRGTITICMNCCMHRVEGEC